MAKQKTIHSHMRDQQMLAKIYAQDGAFHTAAKILRTLADDVEQHAKFCDQAVAGLLAKHRESEGAS